MCMERKLDTLFLDDPAWGNNISINPKGLFPPPGYSTFVIWLTGDRPHAVLLAGRSRFILVTLLGTILSFGIGHLVRQLRGAKNIL